MRRSISKILGGSLLIAGTTIGAGMLALPVSTGLAGFIPALALLVVYWLFMIYTAFLFLEVNLWLEGDINLVSMAKKTLGLWGEVFAWIFYMFLLYTLTTAYIAAASPLFLDTVGYLIGKTLPNWIGSLPLLLIFGYFVFRGTHYVDIINRLMMCGLAIAYAFIVILLIPDLQLSDLKHQEWKYLPLALSLVATSFGFHIIIPSLTTYLDHHVGRLKKTLIIGSLFPIIIYILWDFVAIGTIPLEGPNSITEGFLYGIDGTTLIASALNGESFLIKFAAKSLSFFAIVTSFLGVSLALHDFLADGVGIDKEGPGKGILILLTFVPPLIFALTFSRVFFTALEYAGAFGVVTLLGLLPALMVWSGRYRLGLKGAFTTPGGKFGLIFVILFSLAVMIMELINKWGWIAL
ncbi:MAG: aromatic amino acid transport family protein [Chlamydiales bacterium]